MYLKRLDILGFKSFPTKTVIKFDEGITGIVGPNGCGKTNILDALRWVLGEQKPSLLRGGKMEEVIFNGTRELKPLGMSEVTLTVVNDRGLLPTDYTEVQITRRLFRSGDSEYLLNKVPCRLKDISDLFVDTGMGAHSYSVIQQDMIEAVISDKAEERRFLFEEAAGITKYKQRKRAALRKLEATEHDVLRLQDIYAEVKTRVNSLNRQSRKAERFQGLQTRIKAWELYLSANRVGSMAQEKRELRSNYDQLSAQRLSCQTILEQDGARLEAERNELLGIERSATDLGKEIYSISEKAHHLEREISILTEKRSHARSLIKKNRTDIGALSSRETELAEQVSQCETERVALLEQIEQINVRLKQSDDAQATADKQLLEARASREDEQQQLLELEGKLSSGKTEEDGLKEQGRELAGELANTDQQIAKSSPEQKRLIADLGERRARTDGLLTQKTNLQKRQDELSTEIEKLLNAGEEQSDSVATVQASVEASQARYNLLEEMLLQYEGHESGVVATMEQKEKWPGIAGTVAELFVPVAGMESALEASLGGLAKCLICFDRKSAEAIITYLRSEQKGRVGILVPDIGTLNPAVKRPDLALPGVKGWLDSFVTTDERLRPLLSAILSRTIVFDSEVDIDELLRRLPLGFSAVSSTGLYYGNHLVYGGSEDQLPLFRRKERMLEEQGAIAELQTRLQLLQAERSRTLARLAEARAESTVADSKLETLTEDLEKARKEADEVEFSQRALNTEMDRLSRAKKSCIQKLERIKGRQYNLGIGHTELTSKREAVVTRMSDKGNRLEDFERMASEAQTELSRIQVAAVEQRSKADQNASKLRHLAELRKEIQATSDVKTNEITQAERDITTAGGRITELERLLKETFDSRDRHDSREETLRQTQAQLAEKVTDRENRIKSVRKQADEFGEELHRMDMRLQSADSEIVMLADRIREEYEIDIRSISPVLPDDSPPEGLDNRDYLQQLKDKLKSFGAVNLLALDEFSEASEREKFLREQLDDLTSAKKDLEATILKINQTARKLFVDTFEKVEAHFQNIFLELFTGGEAGIRLIDPSDPLESDIEIMARPRGKKLLAITMMSGGERALTAISLLFALYLVKPSPFCILDEIDAPLDDANCHRFLQIVRKFAHQTQFIIITHNKITMEAADNLYGVTMEQPGVSKLVAVRFASEQSDDELKIDGSAASIDEDIPESIRARIGSDVAVTPDVTDS